MNSIIVAWAKSNNLERHVPLLFNARRNRRLGSKKILDLLFIEGLDLLSQRYCDELKDAGYRIHDASRVYMVLTQRYPELGRFGDYERKCFLRWLVIREVFGDNSFAHYDGDVVFNAVPEELEAAYEGLTFILQGCPAYSQIQDSSWLATYQVEFQQYYSDMLRYSEYAWERRDSFLGSLKENNAGVWDRKLLSSDQDLLQFLTLDGRLKQDNAATLAQRSNFALFQNPICIARDINLGLPLSYERLNGLDYIGGKKVALWHMQSDFTEYLGYAICRRQMMIGGRVPSNAVTRSMDSFTFRALRKFSNFYSRDWLYRRFYNEAEDLSFLLNEKSYWQKGVFA